MTDLFAPTRIQGFLIPSKLDGTGKALLSCKRGTAEYFNLWAIPRSLEAAPPPADGGRAYRPTSGTHHRGKGYRIAYPAPGSRLGYLTARFRLLEGHTKQTLQVLCDHLDAVGAPWLWLCDENGAKLSTGLFHSKNHTSGV